MNKMLYLRGSLMFALFIFSVLFYSFNASANFACGQVNNSDEVPASWFVVNVFYLEQPIKYINCRVSPAEYKFCCDPTAIKGVTWAIGKRLKAEIFDSENGYFSDGVNLTISGEGYDVFPLMQLKKGVKINNPNFDVFVDNGAPIKINVTSSAPFNNLSYVLFYKGDNYSGQICENCNEAEFYVDNLGTGEYYFVAQASDGKRLMKDAKNFTLIENVRFERKITCAKCSGDYVPSNKVVNITLYVNASHNLSGVLSDYFPVDWKPIGDILVENFSNTHNKVSWEVQGSNIEVSYLLRSPKTLFTKEYIFQSELGNYFNEVNKVLLYNFYKIKFLALRERYSANKTSKEDKKWGVGVSEDSPLIAILNDSTLITLAVYPDKKIKKAFMSLRLMPDLGFEDTYFKFDLKTSIRDKDIKNILIQFKVKKINVNNSNASVLFRYNPKTGWKEQKAEKFKEDADFFYYNGYANETGVFGINSTWQAL